MRFATLLLLSVPVWAQTPPVAPPKPAAAAAPAFENDTVVATSEGQKLTAGDINKILDGIPVQMRQNYQRDPKSFLSQWFLLKRLVAMAEAAKLQDQTPYREGIAVARM